MIEPDLPLLSVRNLKVHFPVRGSEGGVVKAVDDISFDIPSGRTVALVGESGCGKSTTAYAIIGLEPVTSGSIRFEGREIAHLDRQARRALATEIQIVFQDPSAALNPKMTIGDSIGEPLIIQGWRRDKRKQRVRELLDLVGLPAAYAERTPNALSGGQRQRVVIARALALSPKLLVLDEPVSALDVSIRSQILNLLMELQKELGLSYLFISHDLSVVRHLADDVIVMYLGTVVEEGGAEALFEAPRHPYTQALISAIPFPIHGPSARANVSSSRETCRVRSIRPPAAPSLDAARSGSSHAAVSGRRCNRCRAALALHASCVRPLRWRLEPLSAVQEFEVMIERKNPSNLAPPVGRYHHLTVIPAGSDILAIAGQVGLDEKGQLPDTVEEQLANAFANITRILQSEGLDHRAVFKINMWLTQPVERERYVEIWRGFHGDEPPASMFAYVSAMIRPEYLVEVEAWAARPAQTVT